MSKSVRPNEKPKLPLLLSLSLFAKAQKDTCRIGIYVNSIYDFRMDEKSYMADFWLWNIYKNDSLSFENTLEVRNSKSTEFTNYSIEEQDDVNWST